MSLRTRIILTIASIALLLAIPGLYAVRQLDQLQSIMSGQVQRAARGNLAVGRLQVRLAEFERLQAAYAAFPGGDVRDEARAALTRAREHLVNLERFGYEEESRPAGALLDRLDSGFTRIEALVAAGQMEEATDAVEAMRPAIAGADEVLTEVSNAIDARSRAEMERARDLSDAAATSTVLALAICMTFAALLGLWTTRALIIPIARLRRAMAEVAGGKFQLPANLPYHRADELGDLSRSFRSMTNRLAELDQIKAEFMSIATHELKTPINVIGGYAELIQEGVYGEVTEAQEAPLISIREQVQALAGLVGELLDISRLEAGGLQLVMEPISTRDLFDRIERSFRGLAEQKNIRLEVELAGDAPTMIMADVDRLRDQVLGNLLSNALKFTPEGGLIRVRGWGQDGDLAIEVADTGPGIAADKVPFVFDKFFQIGEARSKGAGLGLAVAHDIVAAHGGRIEVESRVGEGTRFRMQIPARQGTEMATQS
jgi:signal transduction histidine kinase